MTNRAGRATATIAVLMMLALFVWRARPARIVSARVTSLVPGAVPVAHVSLAYGGGSSPDSVIVDVLGDGDAPLGSVTVDGRRMLLEVPLAGAGESYRVAVTAAHRVPWGTLVLQTPSAVR